MGIPEKVHYNFSEVLGKLVTFEGKMWKYWLPLNICFSKHKCPSNCMWRQVYSDRICSKQCVHLWPDDGTCNSFICDFQAWYNQAMTIPKDILPLCVFFPKAITIWDYQRCTHRHPGFVPYRDRQAPRCPWCFGLTLASGSRPSRNGPSRVDQELQEAVWGPGKPRCPICPSFVSLLRTSTSVSPDSSCFYVTHLQSRVWWLVFLSTRCYLRCSLKIQIPEPKPRLTEPDSLDPGAWESAFPSQHQPSPRF